MLETHARKCSRRQYNVLLRLVCDSFEEFQRNSGFKKIGVVEREIAIGGLTLMFQFALCPAVRMRETYTLQQAQIRVADKTIYLSKSKNGDRRQLPLNSKARAVLEAPRTALEVARHGGELIPLWDGRPEPKALAATTARLSRRLTNVFAEAGSDDLHFHNTGTRRSAVGCSSLAS